MSLPKMKYLLVLLIPLATPLCAQQTVDRPSLPPITDVVDKINKDAGPAGAGLTGTPIDLDTPCQDLEDEATRSLCWEAFRARLRYYENGLAQRARAFAWQHFSTQVIFFAVLGLVVVGVTFAWMQFRLDLKKPAAGTRSPGAGAAGQPEHEVEISPQGIKVSSPVLGVVILALSLGFFYLYLVYVYPITELF